MGFRDEVIRVCAYFFEVLVKNYLGLENKVKQQSGLRSLFKKINYYDRANGFNNLRERAVEAKEGLPVLDKNDNDYQAYSLATKLTECLSIYIEIVQSQVEINTLLHQKANNEVRLSWDDYTNKTKYFDMMRGSLEIELPKLNALYSSILKDKLKEEKQSDNTETIFQ